MTNIEIVKLRRHAKLPQYQTEHSAGMDCCASIVDPVTLTPGEFRMIPLGFAMALPNGYEAQIRARSGLAAKFGIGLVNGVGTIDADYRGEVAAIVINHGRENFTIDPGMRICQLVVAKYRKIEWEVVESLDETEHTGFGSTGVR